MSLWESYEINVTNSFVCYRTFTFLWKASKPFLFLCEIVWLRALCLRYLKLNSCLTKYGMIQKLLFGKSRFVKTWDPRTRRVQLVLSRDDSRFSRFFL